MDIQKELNEWADWFMPHDSKDLRDALELNSFNQLNVEKLLAINGLSEAYVFRAKDSWKAWQAAKAQAVPEGFMVVPKEPTDAMLFAASGRDIVAEHYGDENILWPELRETWKAMIEAQEQKG